MTHRGRKLGEFEDDFKENIELSDDDLVEKGKLPAEYVDNMNFGGGEEETKKKTRKEVFEEII